MQVPVSIIKTGCCKTAVGCLIVPSEQRTEEDGSGGHMDTSAFKLARCVCASVCVRTQQLLL